MLGNNRELPYLNFLVETNKNFSDTIAKKLITTVTYPDNRDISGYTLWENFEIPYLITGFDVSPNFYIFDDATINVNDYAQIKADSSSTLANGDYYIEFADNREIGLGLSGTNIIASTTKQIWNIEKQEAGYYRIVRADNKTMSFDVSGGLYNNGTNLLTFPYNANSTNHRFNIDPVGNGTYRIMANANLSFCISNTNPTITSGDNTVIYQCNDQRPQKFYFKRVLN